MKLALIQSDLVWEDKNSNLERLSKAIAPLTDVDVIILPEMFPTGFTMNPGPIAESTDGEVLTWMRSISQEKNSAICGSVVVNDDNKFYNRMYFVYPDGVTNQYDKKHLFTLAGENKSYTAGSAKKIVVFRGAKICLQICYDLRFPVYSRNVEDYDLLIYVANWPDKRILAWDVLLQARAIENMCFVAGVNRVGEDPNGNKYPGHSRVYDSLGKLVGKTSEKEEVIIVELNFAKMLEARSKLGFLNDRDSFTVN